MQKNAVPNPAWYPRHGSGNNKYPYLPGIVENNLK